MKKITYFLFLLIIATSCQQEDEIFETSVQKDENNNKVDICHNGHIINVSINAIQAHLNHGDKLGKCSDDPNDDYTFVPDDNFEKVLIELGHDDVLDNLVLTSNINTVKVMNFKFKEVSDVTGIEAFEKLEKINCSNNNIVNLDLSNNTLLTSVICRKNNLLSLNVKNGTNTIITGFDARFNFNLECIQVDDEAYSAANWPLKDVTASYSEDCGY